MARGQIRAEAEGVPLTQHREHAHALIFFRDGTFSKLSPVFAYESETMTAQLAQSRVNVEVSLLLAWVRGYYFPDTMNKR
eukprot:6187201-Pleurochrysis_carterae.AAC.1